MLAHVKLAALHSVHVRAVQLCRWSLSCCTFNARAASSVSHSVVVMVGWGVLAAVHGPNL